MNITKKIAGQAFAVSALTLAMNGTLYADDPVVLTLGETITVTGTVDTAPAACAGTGTVTCATLREAVIHANGNANGATKYDVINLPAGTINLTIAGADEDAAANGDLDITEGVNIVGAGVASTTVDGGGSAGTLQERIFTIHGVQVGISDLTMTNGYAKDEIGGTILNDEKSILTLANCAVTNSTATWDGDYTTDTMNPAKDPIPDGIPGTAENPEGTTESQGHGGAIYSKDVMTIENCEFRGNIADNRVVTTVPDPDHVGSVITVKVGNGGAINSSQHTVINNSTFGSDAAIDGDSNTAINGGGVFLTGGNQIEITNSTFSFNGAISGGGICNVSPSAPTTITNSTISGNHVTDSGAGIETNAAMTLTNVTIADNVKDSSTKGSGLNTGPGVSITAKNVLFDNNLADALAVSANCGSKGGGFSIASLGGNVASDSTCDLNVALGDKEDATIVLTDLGVPSTIAGGAGITGTTLTHAFDSLTSAGIDEGVNTGCPSSDQRGSIRPFDATLIGSANCDSGAYELYIERADMHIENMTAPSSVIQGDAVNINVVVDNGSGNPAADVVITTYLPAEMTSVSATPSAGSCTVSTVAGDTISCTIGSVTAGNEASVAIVATASTAGDAVAVTTSVDSSTADPYLSNNSQTVFVDIQEPADIAITAASASPGSVTVGSTSTVTLTVENHHDTITATGIQVSGVLPAIVSFDSGVGCTETAGTVTCSVSDLAPDATASVVFDVTGTTVGTASVTAAATMDQYDTDPSDNSGTLSIAVTEVPAATGGGGFCSYNPNGRFDPVLPALILSAMAYLGFRRKQKSESKIK